MAPLSTGQLDQLATERGLGFPLLSDRDFAYAQICGLRFAMTVDGTALYARLAARFDLTIEGQDAPGGWELPIPAAYVAGRDGIIAYASAMRTGRSGPSRRTWWRRSSASPSPWTRAAEFPGRGFNASSTNALTGGE